MQNGKVVAAGVVAGYLLGRTKKMKLAMMLGAAAMGSRLDMKSLATKGTALLEASPGAQRVASEVRDRMGASGKAVVGAVASKGMDALSDTLQRRTDQMGSSGSSSDAEDEDESYEEEPEEQEQQEQQEQEEQEEPEKPRRRRSSGGGSGGRSRSGSTTTRKRASGGTAKRASGTRQRRSRTSG